MQKWGMSKGKMGGSQRTEVSSCLLSSVYCLLLLPSAYWLPQSHGWVTKQDPGAADIAVASCLLGSANRITERW